MPLNRPYTTLDAIPDRAAVFPLPGVLLLPRGELPLNIFEPRYLAMFDEAIRGERLIGMIQPAAAAGPKSGVGALETVGCLGRITQFAETGDGRIILNLTGVVRFRVIEELQDERPFRSCRFETLAYASDLEPEVGADDVDRVQFVKAFRKIVKAQNMDIDWSGLEAAPTEILVNALAMMAPLGGREKQLLLEAPSLATRADILIAMADAAQSPGSSSSSTLH